MLFTAKEIHQTVEWNGLRFDIKFPSLFLSLSTSAHDRFIHCETFPSSSITRSVLCVVCFVLCYAMFVYAFQFLASVRYTWRWKIGKNEARVKLKEITKRKSGNVGKKKRPTPYAERCQCWLSFHFSFIFSLSLCLFACNFRFGLCYMQEMRNEKFFKPSTCRLTNNKNNNMNSKNNIAFNV